MQVLDIAAHGAPGRRTLRRGTCRAQRWSRRRRDRRPAQRRRRAGLRARSVLNRTLGRRPVSELTRRVDRAASRRRTDPGRDARSAAAGGRLVIEVKNDPARAGLLGARRHAPRCWGRLLELNAGSREPSRRRTGLAGSTRSRSSSLDAGRPLDGAADLPGIAGEAGLRRCWRDGHGELHAYDRALPAPACTRRSMTAGRSHAVHDAGLGLVAWTVTDTDEASRLRDAGVDAVDLRRSGRGPGRARLEPADSADDASADDAQGVRHRAQRHRGTRQRVTVDLERQRLVGGEGELGLVVQQQRRACRAGRRPRRRSAATCRSVWKVRAVDIAKHVEPGSKLRLRARAHRRGRRSRSTGRCCRPGREEQLARLGHARRGQRQRRVAPVGAEEEPVDGAADVERVGRALALGALAARRARPTVGVDPEPGAEGEPALGRAGAVPSPMRRLRPSRSASSSWPVASTGLAGMPEGAGEDVGAAARDDGAGRAGPGGPVARGGR